MKLVASYTPILVEYRSLVLKGHSIKVTFKKEAVTIYLYIPIIFTS